MNTAEYVSKLIEDLKAQGKVLSDVAWEAALACVGWPYVFGARGEYCTPANRRARYSADHPTIKSACKNYEGAGTCKNCKWYPSEKRVRFFDCRGFTYWILLQVYGWKLMGAGATSQWDTASNWKAKGEVSDMPKDTLVCLFVKKGSKMEHTGFGLNNETIECSSGVQHFTTRKAKWTHWGIPACVEEGSSSITPPTDTTVELPTLRKGNRGSYVTLLQTLLLNRGYKLPKYGADGDFGNETLTAVKQFQLDWGLTADGVVGPETWKMLEMSPERQKLYTVTIPHLTKEQAEEVLKPYTGTMTLEN